MHGQAHTHTHAGAHARARARRRFHAGSRRGCKSPARGETGARLSALYCSLNAFKVHSEDTHARTHAHYSSSGLLLARVRAPAVCARVWMALKYIYIYI